jgi:hypothetical protein
MGTLQAVPLQSTARRDRDVFVGGVLCTLSALIIGFDAFMVWVRAGAEVSSFPSACQCDTTVLWQSKP